MPNENHAWLQNSSSVAASHYQRLTATIPAMLYDYVLYPDGTDKFLYVGPRCKDILELSESQLLADTAHFWRMVHAEDMQQLKESNTASNQKRTLFSAEVRIVTQSGKLKWIQLSSQPNHINPGEADTWSGFMLDITERKQTEIQLSNSLSLLNATLEATQDAILVVNLENTWVLHNQRFAELWQIPNSILSSKNDQTALSYVLSQLKDPNEFLAKVTELYSTPEADSFDTIEFKDGKVVERHSMPQRIGDKTIGRVWTFHDVTKTKILLNDLTTARAEAQQSSEAKSNFLASMSHELRSPLNAIIGFAQMLDMGVPTALNPSQKEPVRHILSSGRHLLGLINEVLDLTRIEAGQLFLTLSSVELAPLIENVIALTQPSALPRKITLKHACHAGIYALADSTRIRQILLNLLSNAIKYNREDGMIMLSCQQKQAVVHISVTDTGLGIPEPLQSKLFLPFQRLGAEKTATEGTGIGLAICKKLIEAMGGRIGFESRVNIGSRFWIELPVANAEPIEVSTKSLAAVATNEHQQTRGRVLYVEDSPVNVSVMTHIFSQLKGVELLIAGTAESGLEMIRTTPPDLILMDVNLPGMSGLEALKLLKANPKTAEIPVMAISAAALSQDVEEGLAAGFTAYLTKPFDVPGLLVMVANSLARAR